MKVVILAGGFGTRLSEYTHSIPKPMIKIGNIPKQYTLSGKVVWVEVSRL